MQPTFFESPPEFRSWLEANAGTASELLVGFRKKDSGLPSLTWPESVDEALGFGWIDGVRRRIDDANYSIRFTPRKRTSIWSAINIKRVGELTEGGRMRPAGLQAFEARSEAKSKVYSYEEPGTRPRVRGAASRQPGRAAVFRGAIALLPQGC